MQRRVMLHGPTEWGFSPDNPPITEYARQEARLIGNQLRRDGVDTSRIAASERIRSTATAYAVGGEGAVVVKYPILNEVMRTVPADQLDRELREGRVRDEAWAAAEAVVDDPPVEDFIVGHGNLLAAIRAVLLARQGQDPTGQNLLLKDFEITVLDF